MTALEVVADGRKYLFAPSVEVACGRAVNASVPLGDNRVGRAHARLTFQEGAWTIEDLNSTNGTWIGGSRVSQARIDRETVVHLGNPVNGAMMLVRPLAAPLPAATAPMGVPLPAATAPLLPAGGPGLDTTGRLIAEPTAAVNSGVDSVPVLVVRSGGRTLVFPAGQPVRVGREEGLEITIDHPLVSRVHGMITTDPGGAVFTDSSSRGTYHEGRELKAPLRITTSTTLRLGDPATGEELGITPPLSNERMRANRRRRARAKTLVIAAAVVLVLVLAAGGVTAWVVTRGPTPHSIVTSKTLPASQTSLSRDALRHAEASTVRLLEGDPETFTGWGSGTVISPNGLILTNAHVAAPNTPGAAVALATPGANLEANPSFVTVEFISDDASAAVPKYRARVVAVDGYLDLAVVAIFADDRGAPVDPATLRLPYLKLGDVTSVNLNDNITILGFPGVSGSDSITVTSGVVSTFIPDPLHHVDDPRYEMETTARVAHGNSGGAAINPAGELIGVPSLEIPGQGADLSWRLRSVTEAAPLIAAAKAGTPYQSHILVERGPMQMLSTGVGRSRDEACAATNSIPANGLDEAYFGVDYARAPVGVDAAFLVRAPDGAVATTDALQNQSVPGLPEIVLTKPEGCVTLRVSAAQFGRATLLPGAYTLGLLAGPNLDLVDDPATLTIGF